MARFCFPTIGRQAALRDCGRWVADYCRLRFVALAR
jgi:hypothetical protein